ncbi:MAG TPA: hypothetical protein VFK50_10105 [Sphingomicrobium sp.]|nr:hypothetical protein [Sphingomicrobium sp.]
MLRADPRLFRVFLASALACAGASPLLAAGADYFLKLGGVDGETKGKRDHKDEIEILSYSFGASQADALTDGLMILRNSDDPAGTAKVSKVDSFAIKQKVVEGEGGVSVAAGDLTGDGSAAASGLPTGKRQHKPMVLTRPLDKGSIKLAGSFATCAVGATYPLIEVGGRGKGYKLKNVRVVACGNGTMTANYDGLLIIRY